MFVVCTLLRIESLWFESQSSFFPKVLAQADLPKETSLVLGAHLSRTWYSNRKWGFFAQPVDQFVPFFSTFCCTDNITSTKQP